MEQAGQFPNVQRQQLLAAHLVRNEVNKNPGLLQNPPLLAQLQMQCHQQAAAMVARELVAQNEASGGAASPSIGLGGNNPQNAAADTKQPTSNAQPSSSPWIQGNTQQSGSSQGSTWKTLLTQHDRLNSIRTMYTILI
jgi:hypothetical protein